MFIKFAEEILELQWNNLHELESEPFTYSELCDRQVDIEIAEAFWPLDSSTFLDVDQHC